MGRPPRAPKDPAPAPPSALRALKIKPISITTLPGALSSAEPRGGMLRGDGGGGDGGGSGSGGRVSS